MREFKHLFFIDIETISGKPTFEELPENIQELWIKKAGLLRNEEEQSPQELYFERAGIYAEFGQVVCISVGFLYSDENEELHARIKALKSENEAELLQEFKDLMSRSDQTKVQLCAHNGKEFDFPYLSRRLLINGIALPTYLELSGKKPWEVQHIDTMQLWKFGDYKHYTSLDLLAGVFDIPSPKDDIDGSDVNRVYYEDNDLDRIAKYCSRDVLTTMQVYLKLKGLPVVKDEHVEFLD